MSKHIYAMLSILSLLIAPAIARGAVERIEAIYDSGETGAATGTLSIFTPPDAAGLMPQWALGDSSRNSDSPRVYLDKPIPFDRQRSAPV
jgi:hypothetical protein